MSFPRIFFPVTDESSRISIAGEKAHYLTRVLRCRRGDIINVLDGKGNSFQCVIRELSKKAVSLEIIDVHPYDTESPLNLILLQGLLKGDKMDLVIQKTTELGIKEVCPVITERSQIKETDKVARWRKIAEDASRQSGRTVIPTIHDPIKMDSFFESKGLKIRGFIFWEGGGTPLREAIHKVFPSPLRPFTDTDSPVYIFIGPEGGFTPPEVKRAEVSGLVSVSLGKRILRAETASIVTTALLQFHIGDLS